MSRRTLLLVRWGVFLAACVFLYWRLAADQSTHALRGEWRQAVQAAAWPLWGVLLGMAVLNWGIEAAKWRWLVADLERMGIGRAFAATLAGTTVGLITPNRTGEFVGRILFLAPENRWRGGFATVLGSIAQFVTTLMFGGAAFIAWWGHAPMVAGAGNSWGAVIVVLVAAVAAGALVLFFRPRLLRQVITIIPLLRRWGDAATVLEGYVARELLPVLLMSVLRYLVFATQYVLLLVVLADIGPYEAMVAVPVIYLLTTLVPTMILTDLGVRGSASVALLTPLGGGPALVLLASFSIWAVNVAMPALVGGVILLVARIRTGR